MHRIVYHAPDLRATDRLGRELAESLPDGTAIALCGTLGAGKTRLAQALAEACGVPADEVVSPTFILCRHYEGRRAIYHFDFYRIKDEDELLELGLDEYFESDGLVLIEWADRFPDFLPGDCLTIDIAIEDNGARRFAISTEAERLTPAMEKLRARLSR